tara:strand:+ start:1101 stop:1568 length:468 start_codon:yes stop_codon:yes gene_type:complete
MIDELGELLENFDDFDDELLEHFDDTSRPKYNEDCIAKQKKKVHPNHSISADYKWSYCNFKIDIPYGYDDCVKYPNGDPVISLKDGNGNQNLFRIPQHRYSLFQLLKFNKFVDLNGGKSYTERNVDIKHKKLEFYEDIILNPETNINGEKTYILN